MLTIPPNACTGSDVHMHVDADLLCLWRTCVVLCQILVFVLLLLLAKPGAAGLLLLLGLLHSDARHSPGTHKNKRVYSVLQWRK